MEISQIKSKKIYSRSENILLREFSESDITHEYVSWLNDATVVKFSNQRFFNHTIKSCTEYFETFAGTNNTLLVIHCLPLKKSIGTISIYRNSFHQTADVGILVGDKTAWGNGYGKEAFHQTLITLLSIEKLRKVTAGALSENKAMIKIMESTGMRHEATRVRQELLDGVPTDVMYYGKFCVD